MTQPTTIAMIHRLVGVPRTQRGVTLIIVLLILVVVTILGIGGAQIALLGERSTRYDRDYLVASQAAEAALMDAEFDIRGPKPMAVMRYILGTAVPAALPPGVLSSISSMM
jgi:type IV pilus assembly protein PilX